MSHNSVFIENVAFLPSLLELFDAAMWLEAKGWASQIYTPTNSKLGAKIFQSQISVARGPTEISDGTESERPASQDVVSKSTCKVCKQIQNLITSIKKPFVCRWRRANNATGSSNGQTQSSNGDNVSSGASSDDDEMSQRPLQMYLHHQQYYKQMKELQKQQKEAKAAASDNDDSEEVDVNL